MSIDQQLILNVKVSYNRINIKKVGSMCIPIGIGNFIGFDKIELLLHFNGLVKPSITGLKIVFFG